MATQGHWVRVFDTEAQKDSNGTAFLSFVVDPHHCFMALPFDEDSDKEWRSDSITGCV